MNLRTLVPARRALSLLLAAAGLAGLAGQALATDAQVIVRLRADGGAARSSADAEVERERFQARLDGVARRQGLSSLRGASSAIGADLRVVRASGIDARTLAAQLSRDPGVAYAEPNRRARRAAVPSDPLFAVGGGSGPAVGQWYLKTPSAEFPSAINAQEAWDINRGSASLIVAVLDTGIRSDHPDLADKLVPGYDFVSGPNHNDGGGRDADPSDPGDWVSQADIDKGVVSADCRVEDSSWHGTDVAGIIGAATDNGVGMAGVGWNVKLMNLRVLGKCDGRQDDIVAAMRWAAGIAIPGLPTNSNPARVINLSLGSEGPCGKTYQDAVDEVIARGVVVVASAGNSAGHAMGAPANCNGVIGVGGLRHIGTKVGFSDLGANVAISAPGGNCVNTGAGDPCLFPILTTTNLGRTTPGASSYSDGFNITVGTSFAAPQVAGAAALVLSVQPSLSPGGVRNALMGTARAFPTTGADAGTPQCLAPQYDTAGNPVDQLECYCTNTTCGAGMLDVRAAVLAAQGVQARIGLSATEGTAGQPLTLSAAESLVASGRQIRSFSWALVDTGNGIVSLPASTDTQEISLTPTAAGSFTVSLRVVDSAGSSSVVERRITVRAAAEPPPASGGGGGGGGALGLGWLLLLAMAAIAARRS